MTAIIGSTSRIRVNLKDGRFVDQQVPAEKLRETLTALFSAGLPVQYNEKIMTWIPPSEFHSVVVCEDGESFSWYRSASKATRAVIDRGFIR